MRIRTRRSNAAGGLCLLVALPFLAAAPPAAKTKPAPSPRPQTFPTPLYVQEKYEGVLSVNDHCPVRHGKLHPGIRPTYINRMPVGFC